MTEDGYHKTKELFEKHFKKEQKKEIKTVPLPKMTGAAKSRWRELSDDSKEAIINSAWCVRSLVLRGTFEKCGGEVARTIKPED